MRVKVERKPGIVMLYQKLHRLHVYTTDTVPKTGT